MITTRKVMAQTRRQLREKRGGGLVRPAADLADPGPDDEDDLLARAVSSEPTPEFAAMVAEEYRRLLERLDDDVLRKVAVPPDGRPPATKSPHKSVALAAPSPANWY